MRACTRSRSDAGAFAGALPSGAPLTGSADMPSSWNSCSSLTSRPGLQSAAVVQASQTSADPPARRGTGLGVVAGHRGRRAPVPVPDRDGLHQVAVAGARGHRPHAHRHRQPALRVLASSPSPCDAAVPLDERPRAGAPTRCQKRGADLEGGWPVSRQMGSPGCRQCGRSGTGMSHVEGERAAAISRIWRRSEWRHIAAWPPTLIAAGSTRRRLSASARAR
jgi:hypothetical protein